MQVHVAGSLGERPAFQIVLLRLGIQAEVGAGHAEVVVGDRAAVLVAGVAVRFQRSLVARQRLVQLALNVREDTQVLLHAGAQLAALATEVQRLEERLAGVIQGAGREVQAAAGVQRLRREQVVANQPGHRVAAPAQLAGAVRLIAVMPQHRQPPQGLGQHRLLFPLLRRHNRGFVTFDRFGNAAGALALAGLVQQLRAAAYGDLRRGRRGSGDGAHPHVTRQRRTPRSG